ncbi:MAG: hypothetical protein JXX28_13390 [Deltaproteobacteria bacterium]|nr:hypothetical protein [Deltaproteobacteria bacterium]
MVFRLMILLPLLGALYGGPAYAQAADEGAEGSSDTTQSGEDADSELAAEQEARRAAAEERRLKGDFNRELRTVEQDVNRLKEKVFRSKATLQLLKELVIEGATLGSRVILWHVNKMGPAYRTESIQYFLDGKNVYNKLDPSGHLGDVREVKLHDQAVPPGKHNLQIHMVLRGYGLGVFSYLKTYSFKVQSAYEFNVEDGKVTIVRTIANERPGIWRPFEDRPTVQYEEKVEDLREE